MFPPPGPESNMNTLALSAYLCLSHFGLGEDLNLCGFNNDSADDVGSARQNTRQILRGMRCSQVVYRYEMEDGWTNLGSGCSVLRERIQN